MSQPNPLTRITGTVLTDGPVTIPARGAFRSASGKDYPAKEASTYREVKVLTVASYEGTFSESMQAVLPVKVDDSLPPLAEGEVVDWYISSFAITKPGVNGRSPYPVVANSFVAQIEAPKRSRSAA